MEGGKTQTQCESHDQNTPILLYPSYGVSQTMAATIINGFTFIFSLSDCLLHLGDIPSMLLLKL